MHKNRLLDLEQYQQILENRKFNLAFILSNKKTGENFLYRPAVKSMWHKDFVYLYGIERTNKLQDKFKSTKCRMITLTYSNILYSKEYVAKRHKKDFKKFVREIRKIYPNFEYAYFIELTKKLYVHFHIYTDIYIEQSIITQIWHKITGSYITKIKLIKSAKQMTYCSLYHQIQSKYSNDQLKFAWKNISRFFGQSRHFFNKKDEPEKIFEKLGFIRFNGIFFIKELEESKKNKTIILDENDLCLLFNELNILLEFDKSSGIFDVQIDYKSIYDKELSILAPA